MGSVLPGHAVHADGDVFTPPDRSRATVDGEGGFGECEQFGLYRLWDEVECAGALWWDLGQSLWAAVRADRDRQRATGVAR
ncbi:hypothetical protein FB384_002554 [Prauserella sediminis]|uniref:Uncharacterized protein n=1 Tax=Prauserella sediminis TaxID=577680 RepID=A0A839XK29_9PSEU|nr:hypothetical protein [Prauserella sediminis]